jgi:preprotein translocase subunit YajC
MDLIFFLQEAGGAAAPGAGAAPASAPGGLITMLPMFALMFVVMYFMMIRPQRKQAKEREGMIANLKKNDHVLTSSGIYGIVKQVKPEDPDLTLCIDERKDVCIRVSKTSVAGLVKASGTPEGELKAETQEKKG